MFTVIYLIICNVFKIINIQYLNFEENIYISS